MPIRIQIPSPMRQHTDNKAVVEVAGATVQAALDDRAVTDYLLEQPTVIGPSLEEFAPLVEGVAAEAVLPREVSVV
jgi:hypothetical protein